MSEERQIDADTAPPGSADTPEDKRSTASEDRNADTVPREVGGRKGPDPTRYGDWEKGGRCIDF